MATAYGAKTMRNLILLLAALMLTGCAGLSEEECLTANWEIIGFEDGAAGRSASQIGQHRRDCSKHGVSPDKTAYDLGYQQGIRQYCSFGRGTTAGAAGYGRLQVCPADSDYHDGYVQGLASFCTYDSGYSFGLGGGSYERVCPPASEPRFLDGYAAGSSIFSLQSDLDALRVELNEIVAQRKRIERDQDSLKTDVILDPSLTTEDRARLLLELDDLRDLDDELEEHEDALLVQIANVQARLSALGVEL